MDRPTAVRAGLARRVAREVLRASNIAFPPVNARALVEAKARVILFDDDSEDGMTVYHQKTGKWYVYINRRRLRGYRVSFTWAHEAGHIYLLHLCLYDCNNLSEQEQWILDREANIFAAELLMPRQWVEKYVPIPCGPAALEQASRLFGVSQEVLVHRLEELGIQGRAVTEALVREHALREQQKRLERMSMTPGLVLRWAENIQGHRL